MNFFLNNYLLECDSIYKYNLEHIKLIPKIKKINISLKLDENSKDLELMQKSSSNFVSIQFFLILYISFFSYPFIKYSQSKISKNRFFVLNSILSENFLIYYFLDFFFIENINRLEKFNLSFNWHLKNSELIFQKKNLFSMKFPLTLFEEINEFSIFNNLNINELNFILNFSIENPIFLKLNDSKNFLRNLPYLWVLH